MHWPASGGSTRRAIERKAAGAVDIADAEDQSVFESDLVSEPWFGLSDD